MTVHDLAGATINGVEVIRLATRAEIDATGSRSDQRHWVCRFLCGHVAVKRQSMLLRPNAVRWCSWKCRSRRAAADGVTIGGTYGTWRVLSGPHFVPNQSAAFECECIVAGHQKQVRKDILVDGPASRCRECVAHGRGLSDVIARYRSHAKAAGRAWRLTREQAEVLFKTACFYCGASPSNGNRKTNPYPHNGIDRVENRKGYVLGNVVACCKDCNLAKRDLSASAFIALAHLVAAMHPPGQERR